MSIRVFLADDHNIVRQGLKALLDEEPGIEVVGEAADGREAVSLVPQIMPDVVVMDVAMPGLHGTEATRRIVDSTPDIGVVALSIHSDRRFVEQMLKAGARGYLRKGCGFDELLRAINAVASGQAYLSPEIAQTITKAYATDQTPAGADSAEHLTPREREVLQLLAEGRNSKRIADLLDVSVKTVSTHRQNAMRKLGIDNVADLVKYAIREGLTTLEG